MSEVTKLLINYVKSGQSLEALEAEMVREVKADLQKSNPKLAKLSAAELEMIAVDLVRTHLGARIKAKVRGVK